MIYQCDVEAFTKHYKGPKHHAMICDPPYHLEGGFMGKDWDKGQIAFQPETWASLAEHLLPGAFGFVYSSAYTYTKVANAIEEAGLLLYPSIFVWVYGTGMGRGTRIKDQAFSEHRYGRIALKQSVEPILCFRVPYDGAAQDSISKYGSGALNIGGGAIKSVDSGGDIIERYPPNVALDSDAAKDLDMEEDRNVSRYFFRWSEEVEQAILDSIPLKYEKKASRQERDLGLEEFEETKVGVLQGRQDGSFDGHIPVGKNDHPTVKPIKLSRWLAALLLPPEKYFKRRLLNPFSGSGSEAIGAYIAGWERVNMVEIDNHYTDISAARIFAHTGRSVQYAVHTEEVVDEQ